MEFKLEYDKLVEKFKDVKDFILKKSLRTLSFNSLDVKISISFGRSLSSKKLCIPFSISSIEFAFE